MSAALWSGQWPLLAALLLLLLSAALMLLPFVPAWREWRRPRDAAPLPLSPLVAPPAPAKAEGSRDSPATRGAHSGPSSDPFNGNFNGAVNGPHSAVSTQALHWPAGQAFGQLQAPTVWLGVHGHAARSEWPPVPAPLAELPEPRRPPVPGARPWGLGGWRIDGDAHLPAGLQLHGPLVVHGALQLGEGCRVAGDVKAHGPVQLGPRSAVSGALVALQDVVLGPGSRVTGPLMAQGHLHLSRGARIGAPARPTTASAQLVTAASGSVVHGRLDAREAGVVL